MRVSTSSPPEGTDRPDRKWSSCDVGGGAGIGHQVLPRAGALVVRDADGESVARALGAQDVFPSELQPSSGGLEEAYLRLTGIDPLAGGHGGIVHGGIAQGRSAQGEAVAPTAEEGPS